MPRTTGRSCPDIASWDLAKVQAREAIVTRARIGETMSYSELCDEVTAVRLQPRSYALMKLLDDVCDEDAERAGVVIASLVRHKGGDGMPGRGYFEHAARAGRDVSDPRAFWEAECARVFEAYRRS